MRRLIDMAAHVSCKPDQTTCKELKDRSPLVAISIVANGLAYAVKDEGVPAAAVPNRQLLSVSYRCDHALVFEVLAPCLCLLVCSILYVDSFFTGYPSLDSTLNAEASLRGMGEIGGEEFNTESLSRARTVP